MNHLELDEIQRFLRARMPDDERARVVEHLRTCRDCYRAVEDEKRFSNILALDELPDEPVDVGKVVERVVYPERRVFRLRAAFSAFLFLAALVGGFSVGRVRAKPPQIEVRPVPGVTPEVEAEVAANVDALRVIRTYPNVVRNLDMMRTFEQLLRDRPVSP